MNRMSVKEYQEQLNPREEDEQIKLAELLDSIGVFWFHVPNEIKCKPQYLRKRARLGVKAGVLDNFILEPPPKYPDSKGAVIELKRIKGSKVSKEQTFWIDVLKDLGWAVAVCKGYNAAHEQLREWGYIK